MKTLSRFVARFTSLAVAGRRREGRGTETVRPLSGGPDLFDPPKSRNGSGLL